MNLHRVVSVRRVRLASQLLLAGSLVFNSVIAQGDDNLLAHKLFEQGDYARAGEIFTDPAWKGVALYRSAQWWRAAEAFVRADDPVSVFNLGNCYVKLGYYALALDAYLQSLSLDPTHESARHNADIMRKLLATENDDKQRGGLQPSGEEIEQLDTEDKPDEQGSGQDGDEKNDVGETSIGESEEAGEQTMGSQLDAKAGKGGEASREEQAVQQEQDGSGSLNGETSNDDSADRPSGGSDTDTPTTDSQAAGIRSNLETDQATTSWLNQINHDSQLYLQRRIELEQKRRLAAGQVAPEGGSSW